MAVGGSLTACPKDTTSQPGSTLLSHCVAKPGYYGNPGTAATICPLNKFCTLGSTSSGHCAEGTKTILEGSSSISQCISNTPAPYIFKFNVGTAEDEEPFF
jgi:hypothetical protein